MDDKCPRCKGEMEEGFILDKGYASNLKSEWTTGFAWAGLGPAENKKRIVTYRCKNCGYLESYAK